jgi:DNA-binding transcriptional LysR family regulator
VQVDVFGLQAFVAIAERGHFRVAAPHLNLSQSALNHRIKKLEDSLATLLSRALRRFGELGIATSNSQPSP